MSEITVDVLFNQITLLPVSEKLRLRGLLESHLGNSVEPANGVNFVKPIPMPNPESSMRWMNTHAREYGGQWVALDGDRLIAHGKRADEVFAAADADGAWLPLVTYIPPADAPPFIGV
jgi:Family of unknown function (DUF5678)